ncbi:MAG: hypothetical protein ACYC0N_00340 [Carboxydocellales bacterium]
MTKAAVTTETQAAATAETQAVATTGTKAVAAVAQTRAVVTRILEEFKTEFISANDGLDLDYVRLGTMLKINKKGIFQETRDENATYGDTMDVVVAMGEQRWSLWGAEKSPEEGQLIVAEPTLEEAKEVFNTWLVEHQDAATRYVDTDIRLRYMAFIVKVDKLAEAIKEGETPEFFILPIATTDTYEWGTYALGLFKGKFKTVGIKSKTPANCVITRLTTKEKQGSGTTTFIGLEFTAVGMFVPEEYGIFPEVAPAAEAPQPDAADAQK